MSVQDALGAGRCNTSTLCHYLAEYDVLGYGRLADGTFNDRDRDRANLLKFLVQHPSGTVQSHLVHWVVKGVNPSTYYGFYGTENPATAQNTKSADVGYIPEGKHYERHALDGSDADFQFVNRFINELDENTDFVRVEDSDAGRTVYPTLKLVDLISEGIAETTTQTNAIVHDREFCEKMLRATTSRLKRLSESQKDLLGKSLRRYINRIDDYRLAFDVQMTDGFRQNTRRMTKNYNTRWNSEGRINKNFARLNQSLEWGYENAENAVFVTLTTDPKRHDSLYDAISVINENFHRLTQFLKTDPKSVDDTRHEHVPNWEYDLDSRHFHFGTPGAVSGRPRKRLEYVKVLEFTGAGYPHLHVLFFDVPAREKDGMPWLCDKKELIQKWGDDYEHGEIVDAYPLVYRNDLDDVGNFGTELVHDADGDLVLDDDDKPKKRPVSEGFVCWYQHGEHGHSQEWVDEKTRYHKKQGLIDMEGDEGVVQEKTAGAYVGKYLSETYSALHTRSESFEEGSWDNSGDDDGKAAWWKLAMYWATERRFWSISNGIRDAIRRDDLRDDDVTTAITWATKLSIRDAARDEIDSDARIPNLTDSELETAAHRIVRESFIDIDYLGAFHYDDLPPTTTGAAPLEDAEDAIADPSTPIKLRTRHDRPPPAAAVWI